MEKNAKYKSAESLVERTNSIQENLGTMTVDQINVSAPKAEEKAPQELSLKEIAKREGVRYIEPKCRITAPMGKCPESLKAKRDHDWEYVKGIYENYVVTGEPIKFTLCLYPGDPDYLWEVPANVPVYVPRMVAKHLEECQAYHSFNYVEKNSLDWKPDQETHQFKVTGTHYRGKFRPIGAFS